jgi:hypothetical protein
MPKFYVYTLSYPPQMGGAVFYIGKGSNRRIHMHEYFARQGEEGPRADTIREIERQGYHITKSIVYESDNEDEALETETMLISFHGLANLTNGRPGGGGVRYKYGPGISKSFTLPPEIPKMLTWLAKLDDRSPSYVARRLIEQEYEKRGGPPLDAPAASQDGPGEAE